MSKSKKSEVRIYGVHACQALFKNRPKDIIKVVLTKEKAALFSELMRYLASNKRPYNFETEEEIAQFAKTLHHEGICILAKCKHQETLEAWLNKHQKQPRLLLLALEGVENPHNLGAIIRSSAHFAVDAIFYTGKSDLHLEGSVARVAQGGVEYVTIMRVTQWDELLKFAQQTKTSILTTSDKAPESLKVDSLKDKTLFVLGSEAKGISSFWKKAQARYIKIGGTNIVESLNVSVASGILTALYRQKYPLT